MEIAALILSLVSLLMSGTVTVIYLAKNVFSSHVVQMVPVESFAGPTKQAAPIGEEFAEFDAPSPIDIATETQKQRGH